MQVEIITIGDEILIGQIVDTNSAWMAVELNRAGFEIAQITSVHDREEHILESLAAALERADIVLITGGLGPTKDDITKQTLCKFFDSELVFDEEVYVNIERLLKYRGRAINELTKTQALVPAKAKIIQNPVGTAPVTWFGIEGKVVVSMPGVPYEMKYAMSHAVIPELSRFYKTPAVIHRNFLVTGHPESALALEIADWENALPENVGLAYLPDFNLVKLRLSVSTFDVEGTTAMLDRKAWELRRILGGAIMAEEDISPEEIIGRQLSASGKTLVTAESCTGGNIAHRITSIPGSSLYFKGSVVAYSNELKQNLLQVNPDDIASFGAVSRQVAEQMAEGALKSMNADIAIATTGIAGPDGGTAEKPVGTVWIALATTEKTISKMYHFNLDRRLNIERTTQTALLMLVNMERPDILMLL